MPTIKINNKEDLKRFIRFKFESFEKFSRKMGVSRQMFWLWFRDINKPTEKSIKMMSDYLDINEDILNNIFNIKKQK